MKIGEKFIDDEGSKFVVQKTYDPNPTLGAVAALRSAGLQGFGENKHVARIPGWMVTEWLKEAGVRWDDVKARDEIVHKKLMSGEFSKLRNWQGNF